MDMTNNKIQLHDKVFRKYIDSIDLQNAIKKIASQINMDYQHDTPILLNVLEGSGLFLADLVNYLDIPIEICSVKCSSYQDLQTTQNVKKVIGITRDISNRRIIIVEDIIDTGLTINTLQDYLQQFNVQDIRIATMTFKKESYKGSYPIDYVAIEVENKFIVGHGLDYNQLGRHLKDIYQLDI